MFYRLVVMDVFIYFGFQVVGFSIENCLNIRISNYYVCCVQFFQVGLIYFRYISNVDVQMGNICVEVSNVFFIIKCSNQSWCYFVGICRFCIFSCVFMIWCFQIQCFNQYVEDGVVNNCIIDIDDREQLQFVVVIRQNDEVDQIV